MKELESILKELHLCLSLGSLWWKTSSLRHILHKHDFHPFASHIHSEIILIEFVACFDSSSVSSILKQKIYSTFARSIPVVRVKICLHWTSLLSPPNGIRTAVTACCLFTEKSEAGQKCESVCTAHQKYDKWKHWTFGQSVSHQLHEVVDLCISWLLVSQLKMIEHWKSNTGWGGGKLIKTWPLNKILLHESMKFSSFGLFNHLVGRTI